MGHHPAVLGEPGSLPAMELRRQGSPRASMQCPGELQAGAKPHQRQQHLRTIRFKVREWRHWRYGVWSARARLGLVKLG